MPSCAAALAAVALCTAATPAAGQTRIADARGRTVAVAARIERISLDAAGVSQ